jgi:hypothetical protein
MKGSKESYNNLLKELFDKTLLVNAAKKLEDEEKQIEISFANGIQTIEKQYNKYLKQVKNHRSGDENDNDLGEASGAML